MSDLIYLALVVAFFALAFGLMRACEHIIGPDTAASSTSTTPTAPESNPEPLEVAA